MWKSWKMCLRSHFELDPYYKSQILTPPPHSNLSHVCYTHKPISQMKYISVFVFFYFLFIKLHSMLLNFEWDGVENICIVPISPEFCVRAEAIRTEEKVRMLHNNWMLIFGTDMCQARFMYIFSVYGSECGRNHAYFLLFFVRRK